MYLRFIEIRESIFVAHPTKENEAEVAVGWNNIANFYAERNQPSKALECFQKAIEISKKLVNDSERADKNYYVLANACNNLAVFYTNNNEPQKAEKCFLEALDIYCHLADSSFAVYAPEIAGIRNNLGLHFSSTGKLKEAEKMYLESLNIRRRLAQHISKNYVRSAYCQYSGKSGQSIC